MDASLWECIPSFSLLQAKNDERNRFAHRRLRDRWRHIRSCILLGPGTYNIGDMHMCIDIAMKFRDSALCRSTWYSSRMYTNSEIT